MSIKRKPNSKPTADKGIYAIGGPTSEHQPKPVARHWPWADLVLRKTLLLPTHKFYSIQNRTNMRSSSQYCKYQTS